jgi:uncharacterized damage-inducible protein DinB
VITGGLTIKPEPAKPTHVENRQLCFGNQVELKMLSVSVNELIEFTDWERGKWRDWLQQRGEALKIPVGPNGDGRFRNVGNVVRHIFSAENRYVERLLGRPLTDTGSVSNNSVEALFKLGEQSRTELKKFVTAFSAVDWDTMNDYTVLKYLLRATPRKIITHTLLHEIRHSAQIAMLLRLNGVVAELHDFLFCPVMGGEFGLQQGASSNR